MGKKKTKNKRNSELRVIFFVILIAAALFIVSTYAWFTTQRNISITNLKGVVEVADGLEVSLNAKNWSSKIILGTEEGEYNITDSSSDYGPYAGHRNISPSEMLPVSTLGLVDSTGTMKNVQMLRGKVDDLTKLTNIVAMDESKSDANHPQFPGYFAFDIFLKNTSRRDEAEVLQLNYDSSLQITEADKSVTGLQNTARVAFARFGSTNEDGTWTGVADVSEINQSTILQETGAVPDGNVYITDVAIWEPNSNDHVQYIIDNNNKITWSTGDSALYATKDLGGGRKGFDLTTQMPTYALKSESIGQTIDDIYKWDGTNSSTLQKQVALQTTKTSEVDYRINEGVQNLISTSDASGATEFTIAPNSIVRLRVYVWLEGQDVDCINYASHGGGITLNLGLVKGSTEGSKY